MSKAFKPHTTEENADVLAHYQMGGSLFCGKFVQDTVIRRLLLGLAVEFARTEGLIDHLADELNVFKTVDLITEWEGFLGIPDDCFSQTVGLPIEERRTQVLIKFAKMNVATKEDFLALAEVVIPGATVEITSGASEGLFTFHFPAVFYDSSKQARFTMIVHLPENLSAQVFDFDVHGFPITLDDDTGLLLECLFRKIAPANVFVIFRFNLPPEGFIELEQGGFLLQEDGGKLLI